MSLTLWHRQFRNQIFLVLWICYSEVQLVTSAAVSLLGALCAAWTFASRISQEASANTIRVNLGIRVMEVSQNTSFLLGHGPSPEKSLENRFRGDFLGATWNHYNSNRYYKYSSRKKVPAHWLAHFLVLGHFHMKITKNVRFLGFLNKIVAFKSWMFILYTNILKMLHFVFMVTEFLKVPPGGQIWN